MSDAIIRIIKDEQEERMQYHDLNEEKKMEAGQPPSKGFESKGSEQNEERLRWRIHNVQAKTWTPSPLLKEIRREVKRAIG